MQASDIPTKLPIPFANSAGGSYVRPIPVPSQIGVNDGAASLHDGFPPLTAQPIASGGIPPDIRDFNGILLEISAWARWQAAGGPLFYDSAFSTAVGGYPKGATLQSVVTQGLTFLSKIDNNTVDPDADPTNWLQISATYHTDFANGERTSPDGFIEKWGIASVGPGGSRISGSVAFHTPFPTACFGVTATIQTNPRPSFIGIMCEEPPTLSGFSFVADTSTGGVPITSAVPFFWHAFGR